MQDRVSEILERICRMQSPVPERVNPNDIRDFIQKSTDGRKLLQAIEGQECLSDHVDRMINLGRSSVRVSIVDLAAWLFYRSSQTSTKTAISDLEKYISSNKNSITEHLGVLGIEVKKPIVLIPGISLIPAQDVTNIDVQFFLNPCAFDPMLLALNLPQTHAVLVKESSVTPKFTDQKASKQKSHSLDNGKKLRDLARLLVLIEKAAPVSGLYWTELSEQIPYAYFHGFSGVSGVFEYSMGWKYCPSDKEFESISEAWEGFCCLDSDSQQRVRRVLDRISQSKRRSKIEDKFLDLGIALEMLLLKGLDEKVSLSYKFRLRGSILIADGLEERQEVFGDLGILYGLRSRAAHDGRIKLSKKEKKFDLEDFFQKAVHYTCRCALKIIVNGEPKWEDLILGSGL